MCGKAGFQQVGLYIGMQVKEERRLDCPLRVINSRRKFGWRKWYTKNNMEMVLVQLIARLCEQRDEPNDELFSDGPQSAQSRFVCLSYTA